MHHIENHSIGAGLSCVPALPSGHDEVNKEAYTRAVQRAIAQPARPVSALLKADREQVGSSVWSPDGARIATSALGDGWKVRDSRSGTPIASGAAEKDRRISSITWSPDGRRIVTADDAAQLRIWDPANGLPVSPPLGGTLRERGDPLEFGVGVSWSPRVDRLASIGPDSLLIWPIGPDGATAPPLSVRTLWLLTVKWSPDGSRVATVDWDGAIQIWDPTTGTQDGQPMPGKGSLIGASIAWSPETAPAWPVRARAGWRSRRWLTTPFRH